jgi:hypothetical protein
LQFKFNLNQCHTDRLDNDSAMPHVIHSLMSITKALSCRLDALEMRVVPNTQLKPRLSEPSNHSVGGS